MFRFNHHVTTVVRCITPETDRVRVYELSDPDDWDLPPFTPGAHIDVHLPNQMVRQYSLTGSPDDRKHYAIAVQLEPRGRGGSASMHRDVNLGDILPVSLPRNNFPLAVNAEHHLFIAGGIGITPFVPMIEALVHAKASFELHYCTRERDMTPFRDRLDAMSPAGTIKYHHDGGTPSRGLNVAALLRRERRREHVYCCGPEALMVDVAKATAGRRSGTTHFEFFGARQAIGGADPAGYEVKLARSGKVIAVSPGQTMLAALRAAGVEIDASCEGGVCRTCRTRYVSGVPLHRDLVMTSDERREFITPCVSSSAGPLLILDR